MSLLQSIFAILIKLANAVWRVVAGMLAIFFGSIQYQAPGWMRWIGMRLAGPWAKVKADPRKSIGLLVLLTVLGVGGFQAKKWYDARPRPVLETYELVTPSITDIINNQPPNPLVIRFQKSVAPLSLIDKPMLKGVNMTPAIAGEWRWRAENELEFKPKQDWPVGTTHRIVFNPQAFKPNTKLENWETEFVTPKFVATIANSEFYQDPVNPAMKKVVIAVAFTHPVDTNAFEKRVALKMRKADNGLLGFTNDNIPFVVNYDKWKLNAYIHSAPLDIPRENSIVDVEISDKLPAARGGTPTETTLKSSVNVPGLFSLAINRATVSVVSNDQNEPEHIITVEASAAVHEKDMSSHIKAWVLPRDNPKVKKDETDETPTEPYPWTVSEVSDAMLKTPLSLSQVPAERENIEIHNFKFQADVGRYIYVEVDKGLKSFGGYVMGDKARYIVQVPPFPPEVKLLSQGALLALSGERKVAVLTRDVPGVAIEIGRVLPGQLQHLITQNNGSFDKPNFNEFIGPDNLSERFEKKLPISSNPGKAHYEAIDLNEYLGKGGRVKGATANSVETHAKAPKLAETQSEPEFAEPKVGEKRGIFLLTVRGYDPAKEPKLGIGSTDAVAEGEYEGDGDYQGSNTQDPSTFSDQRLVVVTDLGLIAKKELDGTQVVYVQSIHTGLPVAGAQVEVIAKNGTSIFKQTTNQDGRVTFSKIDGLQRERAPVMYLVKKANDMSFLPIARHDRALDYSRFDVGGAPNAANENSMNAYLFSDRGIYRPGDTMHIGTIVKTANWAAPLTGVPIEAEILDARGLVVKKQTIHLGASGLNELTYKTLETSPTGLYTVNLDLIKSKNDIQRLGSLNVKVQEFLPDRMKVKTLFAQNNSLVAESGIGWLNPKDLKANVNVQNLFGTPAENRRVTATLTLSPAYPSFSAYADYNFYDPQRAKEGYSENLADINTGAEGVAEFKLGLEKYAKATYYLHVLTQAYEAAGGRSVSAETATMISEQPYLVGFKADGELNYVSKESQRDVQIIAINNTLKKVAADALTLNLVQRKYVSVLTKQSSGTFKYESRKKETLLESKPYTIAATGHRLSLNTKTPGDYAYVIKNGEGLELNRIEYSVAGQGNVSRSLERNAELQLTLDKKDYASGETISVNIRAPYVGAGLITIERDKIYAQQWFKADTQSSVQTIELPADFEGNGYINVQFVRDPSSDEIFTSPLSYGVVPFATNLEARTNTLKLDVPSKIKPGEALNIKLNAAKPARVVVFAVDEGILQVARYKNPDPLAHFFEKRSLDVRTTQILDMILPEFKKIMAATAPGGDGDGVLGKHLNPFKRKTDKPVAYWSGIVDVSGNKTFTYQVPDTFNGKLRVLAVAVNDDTIGVADSATIVRGDFVISPNAPLTVTPGDVFEVSAGIANNVEKSGKDASVSVQLVASPAFEIVGDSKQTLKISELREGVVVYKLKAKTGDAAKLGSAKLEFVTALSGKAAGAKQTKLATEISVRPATPYSTLLQTGSFTGETTVLPKRNMFTEYRQLKASASPMPLVAAGGLQVYLDNYEHQCTEQLVSQAMPEIVLKAHPELLSSKKSKLDNAYDVLRSRQNAEGGFGLWEASVQADEFASVYAIHMLLEARDRADAGEPIPADMLQKGMSYLNTLATSPANNLDAARTRAYAIYLLTREGTVTTPMLNSLRGTLDNATPQDPAIKAWKNDLAAAYMAASYQLLQQSKTADTLISTPLKLLGDAKQEKLLGSYYDDMVRNAQTLYLVSRHFPNKVKQVNVAALNNLMKPIMQGRYNTLSSAYAVLGFVAYENALTGQQAKIDLSAMAVDKAGKAQALKSTGSGLVPQFEFAPNTSQIKFKSTSTLPLFYAVTEGGFDKVAPKEAMSQGLEVVRDYVDASGKVITSAQMGDEITVRIKVRSVEAYINDAVIVDLLPGGFEPVLNSAPVSDAQMPNTEDEGGNGGDSSRAWAGSISLSGSWQPNYADIREDRVVFYGAVGPQMMEMSYKVRVTTAGQFVVPPAYAESMYNRLLQARSTAGSIQVVRPASK